MTVFRCTATLAGLTAGLPREPVKLQVPYSEKIFEFKEKKLTSE